MTEEIKPPEEPQVPDTILSAIGDDDRPADVNKSDAAAAVREQHNRVEREAEERNAANEEGHAKNMAAIEDQAHEAHVRTEHAHDRRAGHVPTGKEQNHNTPRVLPDGTKAWD